MSQVPDPQYQQGYAQAQPVAYYAPRDTPGKRPASVTTLSIIGLVFAGLGLVGVVMQLGQLFGRPTDEFTVAVREDGAARVLQLVGFLLNVVVLALLTAGSIASLKMTKAGRSLMNTYAITGLASNVIGLVIGLVVMAPIFNRVMAGKGAMGQVAQSTFVAALVGGFVVSAVWMALVLIFFNKAFVVRRFEEAAQLRR